ncbi:MAG TPA: hypothetical protein VMU24_05485 [Candidatus Acidoferrales bacterium]|nr:hypothetical protein [Candidatus Acidoferrales bacterium]
MGTPTTEFRFPNRAAVSGKAVVGLRTFLWSSVVVLLGFGAYGVFGPASPDRSTLDTLGGVAFLLVSAAVCIAYYYGRKMGVAEQKQGTCFVLTDKELTIRQEGWPDTRIPLAHISLLMEDPERLTVETDSPIVRVFVPRDVEGYVVLRDELAKYHVITTERRSSKTNRMLKTGVGLGLVLLLMVSFYSKHPRIILIAFVCYFAWFVGSSFYMALRER